MLPAAREHMRRTTAIAVGWLAGCASPGRADRPPQAPRPDAETTGLAAGDSGTLVARSDTGSATDCATDTSAGASDTGTTTPTPVLTFTGDRPTRLLVISVDTLRRDHTDLHGASGVTPFLASLADHLVVLDDHAQCSNWTTGSTTCTMAGANNVDRGHLPRLGGGAQPAPPTSAFLAEWLAAAGFTSFFVTANGYFSENWGQTQGFHEQRLQDGANALALWSTGRELLSAALDEGRVPGPWYLHLHTFEPHSLYLPDPDHYIPPEGVEPWPEDLRDRDVFADVRSRWDTLTPTEQEQLRANLIALYQGDIRSWDARLGVVWAEADALGWLDDTLVVFWSDHGEQFWEHGDSTHAYSLNFHENDGILWFWARNLAPSRYAGPTSAIDLVPTLLDAFGLARPAEVTGHAIGTAPPDRLREADSVAKGGGLQMVRRGDLKLVYHWTGEVDVYDRAVDPLETLDLFDPSDPEVRDLWCALLPRIHAMAELVEGAPGPPTPVDGLPW